MRWSANLNSLRAAFSMALLSSSSKGPTSCVDPRSLSPCSTSFLRSWSAHRSCSRSTIGHRCFFDNIENWKRYNCRENVNFSKRKIMKLIMLKLKHFKWNEIRFQHRIVGYQRGAQRDQRGSVSCTTWGGWPIGNRWTWLFAKTCLLDNGTKINWDDIKNIFGREMCLSKWICMPDSSNKKRTSGVQCRSICPLVKLRLWRKRRAGLRQNPRGRLRASSSTRWSVFQTMWIINQKSITMQIAT